MEPTLPPIQLSENPETPTLPPISLDTTETGTLPVPDDVAADRAAKAKIGIPKFNKSYDEINEAIRTGREQEMRKLASMQVNAQNEEARQTAITKFTLAKGQNLNTEELGFVDKLLTRPKDSDPNSVFEEKFASAFLNKIKETALAKPDSWTQQAVKEEPGLFEIDFNQGLDFRAKTEIMGNLHTKALEALKAQGYLGWSADLVKMLSGVYQNLKLGTLKGSPFLGENLKQQAIANYRLPTDEFKAKNTAIVEQLIKDNPQAAVKYTSDMLHQDALTYSLDNILPVFTLSGAFTLGKLGSRLIRGAQASNQTKELVKAAVTASDTTRSLSVAEIADLVKRTDTLVNTPAPVLRMLDDIAALRKPGPVAPGAIHEVAGDIKEAGIQQASKEILDGVTGVSKPTGALEALPSAFSLRVRDILANPGNLRQEVVNKIVDTTNRLKDNLMEAIATTMKVERLPAVFAVEKNVRRITESLANEYPGIKNAIMDIKIRKDTSANLYYADYYIGKNATELFGSKKSATNFISEKGMQKYARVEQQGGGYRIVATPKALDETSSVIREALLATAATKTPDSWLNAWGGYLGGLRTPEEILSLEQNLNRKVATYGPSNYMKIIKDSSEDIKKLRSWALPGTAKRKKWDEWNRVVSEAEGIKDPITGKLGDTIKGPGDLNHLYMNLLQRLPDEQEVAAFFAQRNRELAKDLLENITAHNAKARQGMQTHTLYVLEQARQTVGSVPYKGFKIDGKQLKEAPAGQHEIVVLGPKLGEEEFSSGFTKSITEKIASGEKVLIELSNPEQRPLQYLGKIGEARICYVVADVVKKGEPVPGNYIGSGPLEWKQVRDRTIRDTDYEHYVVQPDVRHDYQFGLKWYERDKSIAGFGIRAMSQDVAKSLDEIRVLLKENKLAEAQASHAASKLPQEWSEVHGWFKSDVTTEGLPIPSKLSLEERIQSVPKGKMVGDMHSELAQKYGSKFRDGSIEGYGKYFQGKRDAYDIFTLENEGTRSNPLYKQGEVKYVDPIAFINRGLNKAINNLYLNDYKIFSVEHWIQEAKAKDLLDVDAASLARNPYYYFYNASSYWRKGSDVRDVNNLMTANFQIKQFLGIQDSTSTFLHSAVQALADSIYTKGHTQAALVPAWLLPKVSDPASFVRSLTFHAKLGLFNPSQFLTQMQTYVTIAGIAGYKMAAPGAKASLLHTWANLTEDATVLARLDELASKQLLPGTERWRPGWFTEARDLFKKTGFEKVGGEYGPLDSVFKNDLIGSTKDQVLNAASFFFRHGEQTSRTAAFYTAFLEHRVANPTGAISEAEARAILNRADLLNVNMSRASSSILHKGIFSVPTQFLSFTLRQTELFMGKRLTTVEKTRLFATYAAMYGLPSSFALSGLPMGDLINKWALEGGYVDASEGSSATEWLNTAVTRGIPAAFAAMSTGNLYNIGQHWGPQGVGTDLMRSDKTMWDIFGGAAVGTIASTVSNYDGFLYAMKSFIKGDGEFTLHSENFVDIFKEISTVNKTWQLIAALNYGKIFSRKEGYLTDTSSGNAIFSYLSGLTQQEISDIGSKTATLADEKAMKTWAEQRFTREFHRGIETMEHSPTQASEYFKNAFTYLRSAGYPEHEITKVIATASKGNESLISQIDWRYYRQNVPTDREQAAQDAYIKKQGQK